MQGVNLDKPIRYINASLRFFKDGEHHVECFCEDDVLLLVYSGVLRFSENGEQKEISAGEYYIQRHGMHQGGETASDNPKTGRRRAIFFRNAVNLNIPPLKRIWRK